MSNLAFEVLGSCGALVVVFGFHCVDELDAGCFKGSLDSVQICNSTLWNIVFSFHAFDGSGAYTAEL